MPAVVPAWEQRYSRKLIWTDAIVVIVVCASALATHPDAVEFGDPPVPAWVSFASAALTGFMYAIAWTTALSIYKSRHPSVFGTGPEEYNRVVNSSLMSFGLVTLFLFALGVSAQRGFLLTALPIGLFLLLLGRLVWRKRLHRQRRRNLNTYRTLLVGERRKSAHTAKQLQANALAGFQIVGAATINSGARELIPGIPVVADYSRILEAVEHFDIDTLIITSSDAITPLQLRQLGWDLESLHVDMILASDLTDVAGPRIHARPVSGLPLIHVEFPQFRGWRYYAKRSQDIFGSLIAIILTSPLLILLAVLVRIDSHGPALFKQQRLGLRGRVFTMYKFRSMRVDAENHLPGLLDRSDGNTVMFKMREDPRVTPVGRFIRRHSLDELPQLFNVLKGDMSLVGPRPPLEQEVERYEGWVNRRLFVRPGISGLWQVSGRSNLTWDESVRIDLYYVENWSFIGDLLILWRTIRTVIRGDGAY